MDGTSIPTIGGTPDLTTGGGSGVNVGTGLGVVDTAIDLAEGIANIYYAQKNYEQQRKIFNWQKKTQKNIWAREDNAVLRRTLDMQRAGINPVLAAGNPANAGAVVPVTAPQHDYLNLPDPVANAMSIMKMKADIDRTEAENKYIAIQADRTKAERDLTITRKKQADFDYQLSLVSGIGSNASTFGKWWKEFLGAAGNGVAHDAMKMILDKLLYPSKDSAKDKKLKDSVGGPEQYLIYPTKGGKK